MQKKAIIIRFLLVFGVLVLGNVLLTQIHLRADLTADKRYTLSSLSKEITKEVNAPITVRAYFSDDLPPEYLRVQRRFRQLLAEYEQNMGANLYYEFVNPNKADHIEEEAIQRGVKPTLVGKRKRDRLEQQKVYAGAMIQMGENSAVIPIIRPGDNMEYEITLAIKKLIDGKKPEIAFIRGIGSPAIYQMKQWVNDLNVRYEVSDININNIREIPKKYEAIVIAAPMDTMRNEHFDKLDKYLSEGGNAFIAAPAIYGDLMEMRIDHTPNRVRDWLSNYQIDLKPRAVVSERSGYITVQERVKGVPQNKEVDFPFFPIATDFPPHPINQSISSLFLPFAGEVGLGPKGRDYWKVEEVVRLSGKVNSIPVPIKFDPYYQWKSTDFRNHSFTMALALDGEKVKYGKLFVVNCAHFLVNDMGDRFQELNEDNIVLATNAVDWLTGQSDLSELRAKRPQKRPLASLDEQQKTLVKYGNVTGPILLLLFVGLWRFWVFLKKSKP